MPRASRVRRQTRLATALIALAALGACASSDAHSPVAAAPTTAASTTTTAASTTTTTTVALTTTEATTTTTAATTTTVPPTTTTAPPATTPAPPKNLSGVLAVGDSVMLGAKTALQRIGIKVDAAVSRSWNTGVSVVKANPGYGTVVFQLGHNHALRADACDRLLSAVGGRRLVLMTIQLPERDRYVYEDPNNSAIRACAARAGASVVDWNGATESTSGALARDGIHLNPKGAALMAWLVVHTL